MARVALRVALLALLCAAAAQGQTLARLHVRSFTMTAAPSSVNIGEPFHLTIAAHVDEATLELDNVTLPDLSGFDSLGDERRCTASPHGSDCSETITLAATVAGDRTIAAASMDAVDARNGKPSRFSTNTVSIHVMGPSPLAAGAGVLAALLAGVQSLLRAFAILALLLIAVLALQWGFARRRSSAATPAVAALSRPPPQPAPPIAGTDGSRLRALVDALAREPTRERARAVREELRARLGAREDETLADLVARTSAASATLASLAALERATFCEDGRVEDAIREALPYLNQS